MVKITNKLSFYLLSSAAFFQIKKIWNMPYPKIKAMTSIAFEEAVFIELLHRSILQHFELTTVEAISGITLQLSAHAA